MPDSRHARLASRPLLHEDLELAAAVPPEDRARATRALRVGVHHLGRGAVDLGRLALPQSTFALLITRGAVTTEVFVSGRVMTEMLVDGDALLPHPQSPTTPESSRRCVVIQDTTLAVLDRRFLLAAAHWPALMREVMRRLAEQQHRLAVHGAICQLPRVEQRIVAILCHLASRTGMVTPQGVVLRQALSHQDIASLVGAQRPTISLALASLRAQDLVRRRDDGSWLLPKYTGQPIDVGSLISSRPTGQRREVA